MSKVYHGERGKVIDFPKVKLDQFEVDFEIHRKTWLFPVRGTVKGIQAECYGLAYEKAIAFLRRFNNERNGRTIEIKKVRKLSAGKDQKAKEASGE